MSYDTICARNANATCWNDVNELRCRLNNGVTSCVSEELEDAAVCLIALRLRPPHRDEARPGDRGLSLEDDR